MSDGMCQRCDFLANRYKLLTTSDQPIGDAT